MLLAPAEPVPPAWSNRMTGRWREETRSATGPAQDHEEDLAGAEAECPDRKPRAIGIPVSSGLQSYQVMEVGVADVLAERTHDAPRVVVGSFDVHGHPVPAEFQVAHTVPVTEMPRGLREVRMRLEPEPASVPDRAEHDLLGENQRRLYGFPRITAEGISAKRRELPPLDHLRPQGVLHTKTQGVD